MPNRFDFYEVVVFKDSAPLPEKLKRTQGVIMGMAEDANGNWEYAVQIADDDNECWQLDEANLEATGKKLSRGEVYPGDSELVRVDPDTGEGSFVKKDGFN